eukprot:320460-Chlamydomonas_euryale.AAC.1
MPWREQFKAIYPLAIINVVGNVLTNVSLGLVAVSFTHTVKAAEPFFSVLFSYLFLGDLPPYQVCVDECARVVWVWVGEWAVGSLRARGQGDGALDPKPFSILSYPSACPPARTGVGLR